MYKMSTFPGYDQSYSILNSEDTLLVSDHVLILVNI